MPMPPPTTSSLRSTPPHVALTHSHPPPFRANASTLDLLTLRGNTNFLMKVAYCGINSLMKMVYCSINSLMKV